MRVVKWKDFLERVAWTFVQAYVALGAIDWIATGINLSLLHQLYVSLGAAVAATLKVLLAQNFGKHPDGAAIPGGITKPAPAQWQATDHSTVTSSGTATVGTAQQAFGISPYVSSKKPAAKRKTSSAAKKTAKRPPARKPPKKG